MPNILGISAYYHDAAAAILRDGQVVAAAQEERFSRIKHDPAFPVQAIKYCLMEAGLTLDELDAVVFYDKPLLKFERLLETYYAFAPRGLRSFLMAMPLWLKEKLFLKRILRRELAQIGTFQRAKLTLLFPEHHLSHAASAFYPSPYQEAAILTIDGVGEWATASISHGKGRKIKILRELHFPHSLGLLYSAFTYFLGFRVNSGEYKLMGLAPYGDPKSPDIDRYIRIIETQLADFKEDGSLWLNQHYFDYAAGFNMANAAAWAQLFGFKKRAPEDPLEAHHCNLGLAIQRVTEATVLRMAREAKRLTAADYLCLAGGVALNCVANGKIQAAGIFKDIFIQPAAGDAGGALGAALSAQYIYYGIERQVNPPFDSMQGSFLGPATTDHDVQLLLRKYRAVAQYYPEFELLANAAAALLDAGNVVGWVQGRMEFGPRALGNRSILGDARNRDMQQKLNLKIKYRESFRPFAPSVQSERVGEYFDYQGISPYMLLVHPVKKERRTPLPAGYDHWPVRDKLYHLRSDLPSITHMDGSARIQTVHRQTNPRYWALIEAFRQRTGVAVLVNTSFNVRGEPIVCTADDAYRCFMRTEMDYLVVGNFLFDKQQQPEWPEKDHWKTEFELD